MDKRRIRFLLISALFLSFTPTVSNAEEASSTSVLYHFAGNLRDTGYGYNAVDGAVNVITLEHFGLWDYGDNYFFIDMISGRLADPNGNDAHTGSRLYMEVDPRLSLSKITGKNLSFGIVGDVLLAAQLNRSGEGFMAEMYGVGVDLTLPGFAFFQIDAYVRKDNFNGATHQVTAAWGLPFMIGPVKMLCEGYVDSAGTDNSGEDVNSKPRLLAEIAHSRSSSLMTGVEWYYHRNNGLWANVPQWTLKWAF